MDIRYITKTLFVIFLLFFGTVFSQTVHQVSAGDSTLAAAVSDAADGDIIELVSDGGVYTNPNQMVVSKNLVIRGHADLIEKPIIKYVGSSTGAYIFKVEGSPRIEFENLEFDGDGTAEGGAALAKYALRLDNADTSGTMQIFVNNCVMHDFNEKIIKPYANCGMDSLVVRNSIFYNGAKEGIVFYTGSSGDPAVRLKYGEVSNSTFYNFVREAIKGDTNPDIKLVVDHCTFYDCGGPDKPFIYVDDLTDVVVKNSIMQKNLETGNFMRFESDANVVSNIVFWDVNDIDIDNTNSVTDTLLADPLFADAANGDFTLMEGSPAIGYADDGSAVGDPRWDPTVGAPKVHKIEAGTDVLKAAIDAAADGDIIELVSSGGMYLSADQIVLDKNIVIRGRAELAQKPVLKYIGTSTGAYMFKIEGSPRVEYENLEFDGDGTAEGGAALAKYALRLDNGDTSGTMQVFVENCVLHDFNEKIIKPYANCGMDSLVVRNSILYNGAKEGIVFYTGSSGDPAVHIKYGEVSNCTFYNFVREAIKGDTNPDIKLVVDHCTFYDIGGPDKPFIYVDDLTDVVVKNSVMQKNLETGNFMRFESDANVVSNVVFWDVFDRDIDNTDSVTDTLYADPLFADAEAGDFTLGETSPARTAGEGGTPVGDLRWAIDPNAFLLSVSTSGGGIVQLDPAGGVYDPGTVVTMTAVPDLGWEFESWTGNVFPPNANPINITMNKNESIVATFKNLTPQVTVEIDTIGLGHVDVSPEPIEGTYDQGTSLTLTAVPQENWEFVEWLGDISGTENPTTFAADSNMNVTASFQSTLTQFDLVINVVGRGSVTQLPTPVIATYDTASVVELTGIADLGWEFSAWTGDLESGLNPASVQMDSNITITATFMETQYSSHSIEVDTSWNLLDAVQIAINNSFIDSLILVTDGGEYLINNEIILDSTNLVIRGKDDLEQKPIIKYTGSSTSAAIFKIIGSPTVVVENLEIDGDGKGEGAAALAKYFLRLDNGDAEGTMKVFVNNVTAHDMPDKFIKLYSFCGVDSLIVHNSVFYNNAKEGISLFQGSSGDPAAELKYAEIVNCTFYNLTREGIKADTNPNTVVRVDHCTFYDCGGPDKPFIYVDDMTDFVVKNSIFEKNLEDGNFLRFESDENIVSNIIFWDLNDYTIDNTTSITDTLRADPMFKDPANGDFTLLEGSPAYGFADDGKAAGDLRWEKFPVGLEEVVEIIPQVFYLKQNYPNPFNPSTTITFGLNKAGKTKMVVYNVLGREVATLVNKEMAAGTYTVQFQNSNLASGVYFYRLTSGKNVSIKKMLLVK
ncbi:MAG: DUF5123 domain-containing protein [Calditrichaeota bacterium]|nr:MAG: DUF5123 domain-containing protein [Calditrichota bacterium]MBL1208109.1 DUF5123 domain-containing protein [Calditrichota bacterium]NOG47947.1 DUF5123 domain-containing protein [Calditrichota bacterium]